MKYSSEKQRRQARNHHILHSSSYASASPTRSNGYHKSESHTGNSAAASSTALLRRSQSEEVMLRAPPSSKEEEEDTDAVLTVTEKRLQSRLQSLMRAYEMEKEARLNEAAANNAYRQDGRRMDREIELLEQRCKNSKQREEQLQLENKRLKRDYLMLLTQHSNDEMIHAELTRLEEGKAAAEIQRDSLQEIVQEKDEEITQLRLECSSALEQVTMFSEEVEKLKNQVELDAAYEHIDRLLKENKDLELQLNVTQQMNAQFKQRLSVTIDVNEHADVCRERDQLKREKVELTSRITELATKLHQAYVSVHGNDDDDEHQSSSTNSKNNTNSLSTAQPRNGTAAATTKSRSRLEHSPQSPAEYVDEADQPEAIELVSEIMIESKDVIEQYKQLEEENEALHALLSQTQHKLAELMTRFAALKLHHDSVVSVAQRLDADREKMREYKSQYETQQESIVELKKEVAQLHERIQQMKLANSGSGTESETESAS